MDTKEEMISMDKDPPMIPVTVVTNISHERMVDLIVGAFEGGSTSWLSRAASPFLPHVPGIEFNNPAYSDTRFWRAGGQMLLTYDNPGKGPKQLTKAVRNIELIQGLQIMAQQYPRHFADFMQENDDADTADVFMQCVVLCEVVYG